MQNSCSVRARVRARDTPIHIFYKRQHFVFRLLFFSLNGYDKGSDKKEIIPNRSLDSEQILFVCWADGFSLVWRRSRLRREQTRSKMPTRKWKMAGSYLLHNNLHYNGLMTDWGLSPTFLQKRGSFFQKRGSFFRKRWRFSERCPTYYFISCDIHASLSLDIASAQVLKQLPEEGISRIIRIFVTL